MSSTRIGHYLAPEETTLLDCLSRGFRITRDEGQNLISFGAIYVDRRRVRSDQPVSTGQYIRAHLNPKRFPVESIDWRATVVHHDEEFVVVNKPAGIPIHATLDNALENVLHQVSNALGLPLYITQRLDHKVSGLVVFAKTLQFQSAFNRLLASRQVKKRYRARVTSPPALGRHVHYMKPDARGPKTVSSEANAGWLECALRVISVTPAEGAFEVEIDLETGRTHQIRAQLSALGSPIIGDTLYGSPTPHDGPGIALSSVSVAWGKWAFK